MFDEMCEGRFKNIVENELWLARDMPRRRVVPLQGGDNKKPDGKVVLGVVLVAVSLIGITFGAYMIYDRHNSKSEKE